MAKKTEKTKSQKKGSTQSFFQRNIFELIIVAFCFLIYSNSLLNGYNMDDELVTRNHRLTSKGISAIPEIFTSPYYQDDMGYAYEYRPVVLATFAIEHSLFGDNPFVSHLFNLLLYALLCFCLFRFLERIGGAFTPLVALCITLLFCAHPSHTEVVCSIKNRDEILGLLFCSLASQTSLTAARRKNWWFIFLSAVLFLLAMLCKSTFVPFAFLIPLIVILFNESSLIFTITLTVLLGLVSYFVLDITQAHYKLWFVLLLITGVVAMHSFVNGISTRGIASFFKKQEPVDFKNDEPFSGLRQWFSDFNRTSFYSLAPTAVILFIYLFWCIHTWCFLPLITFILTGSIYLKYKKFKYWNLSLGLVMCIGILGIEMLEFINATLYDPSQLRMLNILLFLLFIWGKHTVRLSVVMIGFVMNYYLLLTPEQSDLVIFFSAVVFSRMLLGRKLLLVFLFLLAVSAIISSIESGVSGLFSETGISLVIQLILTLFLLNLGDSWTYLLKKKNFVFAFIFLLMASCFVYQYNAEVKNGIVNTLYSNKDYLNVVKTVVETKTDRPLSYVEFPLPPGTSNDVKLGTSLVVLGHYLKKTLLPYPLSFYYGYAFIKPTNLEKPAPVIFAVTYFFLILTLLFLLRKNKNISFGLIIYLLSVLAFSGYFISVPGIVGDRYLLVPTVGWSIVITLILLKIWKVSSPSGISETKQLQFPQLPKGFIYIFGGILSCYSCLTFYRNFDWKNDLTLFRKDINYVTQSAQAHNLLAIHLMKNSFEVTDASEQKKIREEALIHFKAAIEIYPPFYNVAFDLGRTYATLSIPDSALVYFKRAIAIDSANSDVHLFVAKILVEGNHNLEAIPYFEYRIKNAPTDYASYETLSFIYFSVKEYQKSIAVNTNAAKQFPALPDPLINIGKTFMVMNEKDSARAYFQKAFVLNPNNAIVTQLLQQIGT